VEGWITPSLLKRDEGRFQKSTLTLLYKGGELHFEIGPVYRMEMDGVFGVIIRADT
jgi:hypothetical protein